MLFDEEDIEKIQAPNIFADVRYNTTYARTRHKGDGRRTAEFMHNVIMNYTPENGNTVDHINGNGLDNRKSNLRIVSQSVQMMNARVSTNVSGIVGICVTPSNWEACFKYNKTKYRKLFPKTDEGKLLAKMWMEDKKNEIIPENERVSRVLI